MLKTCDRITNSVFQLKKKVYLLLLKDKSQSSGQCRPKLPDYHYTSIRMAKMLAWIRHNRNFAYSAGGSVKC